MRESGHGRMRGRTEEGFIDRAQFFILVRKRLYRRFHALARPLAELADIICPPPPSPFAANALRSVCATDGRRVFWNRQALDEGASEGIPLEGLSLEAAMDRAEAFLLHQVIHCLFGHPFSMPASCSQEVWSLSCDLAAWHISGLWIPELLPEGIRCFFETFFETRSPGYRQASHPAFPLYQARRLAQWLDEGGAAAQEAVRNALLQGAVFSDSHDLWPVFRPDKSLSEKMSGGDGGQSGDGERKRQYPAPHGRTDAEAKSLWNRLEKQLTGKNAPLSPEREHQESPGRRGGGDGGARYSLRLSDTRRHDYRSLLKSLAVWGEEMKLNDNEFQYASYLYGLEHYDGMPLLEPLEYEETARIRELAIVIDTSASCSRSMTRAFLEETRNLLSEESLFFHPFNLHIIQCDKEVRRDDKLTSPEDLRDYIDTLEICGVGGTDFRPAFSHIQRLQECHEFLDLSAILFFTDGSGIYPGKPPEARTIFLFLNGHYDSIDVPDWAEILVLQ